MAKLKEGSTIKGPSTESYIASYRMQTLASSSGTILVEMGLSQNMTALTLTGSCVLNADGGYPGQEVTFLITSSGSHGVTFNTNFKSQGTLTTSAGKYHTVSFKCGGSGVWYETSRTTAM